MVERVRLDMIRIGIAGVAIAATACGGVTTSTPGQADTGTADAGGKGGSTAGLGGGVGSGAAGPGAGEGGPYFFCQWEDGNSYKKYCPPTVDGWGYSLWHVSPNGSTLCSGGTDCNACGCYISCTGNHPGECPSAGSGTAKPECLGPPTISGREQNDAEIAMRFREIAIQCNRLFDGVDVETECRISHRRVSSGERSGKRARGSKYSQGSNACANPR